MGVVFAHLFYIKSGAFLDRIKDGAKGCRGFSMAEALTTVAIFAILLALAVVGIFNLYWSLQQKELDSKAEIIYMAAQDQMTKVMAAGRSGLMAPGTGTGATQIPDVPGDATDIAPDSDQDNAESNYVERGSIAYLTSKDFAAKVVNNVTDAATLLFGDGGLDDELLNENWVIEYDYKSLTVYAVFFNPDDAGFTDGYVATSAEGWGGYNEYRNYKNRLKALKAQGEGHKAVGYHGGAGSAASSDNSNLSLRVEIKNNEKLTANITCDKPFALDENVVFRVDIKDQYGNAYRKYYTCGAGELDSADAGGYDIDVPAGANNPDAIGHIYRSGYRYSLKLVLDSLEGGQRFTDQYGANAKTAGVAENNLDQYKRKLVDGSDITVDVLAFCPKDKTVQSASASATDNSLFAKETADGTAHIAYGRHLQNLDESSGVTQNHPSVTSYAPIIKAVQDRAIDFTQAASTIADENEDWFNTYGGASAYFNGRDGDIPSFKSIQNTKLATYDGQSFEVRQLHIKRTDGSATSGCAGLFAAVNAGSTLELGNVKLVSPYVKCSDASSGMDTTGNVGALVGEVGGTLKIKNCQVYLVEKDRKVNTQKNTWIQGVNAGGLVGRVGSGASVEVENSSASTVIGDTSAQGLENSTAVGGLVGAVENGALAVKQSYSDSYLMGRVAGGLVGAAANNGSTQVTIDSSYAAGFLAWSDAGAGILGQATRCSISHSYSVMDVLTQAQSGGYTSPGALAAIVPYAEKSQLSHCYYLWINHDLKNANSAVVSFADSDEGLAALKAGLAAGNTDSPFASGASEPYNLMNQGLTPDSYAWPVIAKLKHYGDWTAGFKAGSLVYYEKYLDKSYGFEGANVPKTLRDNAKDNEKRRFSVVGDGYGIVYKLKKSGGSTKADKPSNAVVTVTDTAGKTVGTLSLDSAEYCVSGDYAIFPLSQAITNAVKGSGKGFFFKAVVSIDGTNSGTFYFNPHFARTQRGDTGSGLAPELGDSLYLRSARQLYNLSRFYGDYRDILAGRSFSQERNIDYDEYEWTGFANTEAKVDAQAPIGISTAQSFNANYNGNCHEITNVSFVSTGKNTCAGLFGAVAKGSTVQNVVLCTDYDPGETSKSYFVRCADSLRGSVTAYLGVLAGYNAGKISNCAVSGYYIAGSKGTIVASTSSTVHVGGLVGANANTGRISNCSADSPRLRLSALSANVTAAGFVGINLSGGKISNSYALGAVELAESKNSSVNIAGFAGKNSGRITSSYTATALEVSGEGAQSFGFAPKGGYVPSDSCFYLNNGTYSYLQKMYSYNFRQATSSGTPLSYEELKATSSKGQVKHSYYCKRTDSVEKNYPYRGVVKDAAGDYVHYGNWQDDVTLGSLGVFYWEHEENGSNDGYHMTYLGTKADGDIDKLVHDTSLCTAHNDGGVITSYGYGFYVQGGSSVRAIWDGIDCSSGNGIAGNPGVDVSSIASYNKAVSNNLKEQMANSGADDRNYAFYAFTTKDKDAGDGSDYITLSSKTAQNGSLTLALTSGGKGTGAVVRSYQFKLSPLFANAMSISAVDGDREAQLVVDARNNALEGSDGMKTSYGMEPGKSATTVADGVQTAGNAYEIRSLGQLQYINWNATAQGTGELSTASNYKQFNYLMYPNKTSGINKDADTGSIDKVASQSKDRSELYWTQTHDVSPVSVDGNFTPIAGTYESSGNSNYNAAAYLWFGGTYNGQSYTIKNIDISSNSFNVGLFGTTVGANISNVIMSCDSTGTGTHIIERKEQAGSKYPDKLGAYSIGGLVGVAFDYEVDTAALAKSGRYITNCAISGYSIVDNSTSQMGLGEVNIGGLIGVANVNLKQCSANVSIYDNAKFKKGIARYGVYHRIGGLCGGAQGNVTDCYTGGSFDFPADIAGDVNWNGAESGQHKFFIGVGGIAGSAFTSNYVNLTGLTSVRDGSPVITNCYTYFSFPNHAYSSTTAGGTTPQLVMSTIASRADRNGIASGSLTINNCYYYNEIPAQGGTGSSTYGATVWQQYGTSRVTGQPIAVSYEDMSSKDATSTFAGKLNGGGESGVWDWVTTENAGGNIDGKFSFPSGNDALEGKNYPFPTVVTQNDLTFGTFTAPSQVHVHYGDWPLKDLSYWEKSTGTIDIFSNRPDGAELASNTFRLHVDDKDYSGAEPGVDSFALSDVSVARVCAVQKVSDGIYDVTLEALTGSTASTIVTLKGTKAEITVRVTANLDLSASLDVGSPGEYRADTSTLVLDDDSKQPARMTLTATSAGVTRSDVTWTPVKDDESQQTVVTSEVAAGTNKLKVTRSGHGDVLVAIAAGYSYNGASYQDQLYINVIEPSVLGLSAGDGVFSEVKNVDKKQSGSDGSYPDGVQKPSYQLGDEWSFYLYSANDDSYFDTASKLDKMMVAINDGTGTTTCKLNAFTEGSGYYVTTAVKTVKLGAFKYLPVKVSYLGSALNKPVTVTVTLPNKTTSSTLVCKLGADALKKADTATLSFKSSADASATTKTIVYPKGCTYVFGDYSDVFGSAPASGRVFDEWKSVSGTSGYYREGDEFAVTGNASFVATTKRILTLSLARSSGSPVTKRIDVGRAGVEELGTMSGNDTLFNRYRLDGWYWYESSAKGAVRVANADGSLAADGVYAGGTVEISDGKLTLSGDVVLHAAKATWSLASKIVDGQDYLLADADSLNSGSKLNLVISSSKDKTDAYADSAFEDGRVATKPVYKLTSKGVAVELDSAGSSKAKALANKVDDTVIWHASAQEKYGSSSTAYFSFANAATGLYLTDAGAKYNGKWVVGGIEDVYANSSFASNSSTYDAYRRSAFMLKSNGRLGTFNNPSWWSENYYVNFYPGAEGAVLCVNTSSYGNFTYLYEKNLEFTW